MNEASPGDPGSAPVPEFGPSATPSVSRAPDRPTSMQPEQLGFTPRRAVGWLGPSLLAGTAVRVALAELFGAYLDKRELQNALAATIHDERADGDLWLDYVADLGDGFDATYSIAYLLAQPELVVDGERLPRGRILVMGGDEVYPTPSSQRYEDRLKGPYRAAFPTPPADGERPVLYALPGNHDWYDGLTAFLRVFARGDRGSIGGWRTSQSRSYFAIQLTDEWWLYAIDTQFGAYLDDPQLRYFEQAARQLRPTDRVIVCPPTPGWVEATVDPAAYDTTDYFVRTIIEPTGATVGLMLSGDLHHYARYSEHPHDGGSPGRQLITCGAGGAYLFPTHRLPERITVPPPASLVRAPSPEAEYSLAATYPPKSRSRRLAAGVFGRLPRTNPGFIGLLGVPHLLLMYAMANAASSLAAHETQRRLAAVPLGIMITVVIGATLLFAMPPGGRRTARHWVLGLGHGLAHVGLAVAGTWAWRRLPLSSLEWPAPELLALVGYAPLIGLAAAMLFAGYLLVASAFEVNVNELFASQSIADWKCFLRIRIGTDGAVTIYPVAVDRVCRRWTPDPHGRQDQPWLRPSQPLRHHLAEPPIHLAEPRT